MRITDDRLDELVEDFVNGCFSDHAVPAVLLALTELQDRRDDEYDDANDNYETALDIVQAAWDFDPNVGDDNYETVLDIVQAAHPDEDYSWARPRDDDPDDGVSWDDEEAYLAGDGIPDDDRFFHVPPWDFDPDVGDDDDDTF
jgi:hypothetical protein